MPNVINATSTGNGGLITQGDDSGILNIQTNETTAISIDASQNLSFTKGFTVGSTAFPTFSASKSGSQSISSDTVTKIIFDVENFDTNNNFASSRFTPTVAGYYIICCAVYWVNGTGSFVNLNIFKNGSVIVEVGRNTQASGVIGGSSVIYCNGSTDYIELYLYSASGTCLVGSSVTVVNFNGAMIRSA